MNNVTTFDNFPPFATNGSRNMNTESAKYQVGFLEGETFPAEWANYLFHGATKGVSDLNTAVQSIWKENINVIQGSGQTPSPSDNTQLKTAIELMIQNAVLTANAQVLAQAKLDAHPVGSLYWSSDPTDPSVLFGGTWTQIKDKFIWAKGDSDTVNATGGSKTVQLTEGNLPAHTHNFSWSGTTNEKDINHVHYFSGSNTHDHISGVLVKYEQADSAPWGRHGTYYGFRSGQEDRSSYYSPYTSPATITISGNTGAMNENASHSHSYSGSGTTGGGNGASTAFSVLPPYIVKFCWERTA